MGALGEGKGDDVELAQLLEDTIGQAEKTIVDHKSEAGAAFLIARPHHIRNAWAKVIMLLQNSGHQDLANQAQTRADASISHLVQA